jgi:DHA2 family multidrug resistance protein-like MFS transporter
MIEHWWWGSVFLLGVPVMLVTVAAAPRLLPEYRDPSGARPDLRSAALCLGSILLVVYALKAIVNNGWSPQVLIVGAMGLTAGVVFVRRQRRLSDPLVDLDLLRSPGVARTLTVLFLTALVMGGTSLFVSFYLQTVQGLSPLRSALWLLPQMGAMIISANVGPRLAQRIDPNRMLLASLSSMTVGFALFALVPLGHGGMYVLVTASVLTTGGVGAAFPQLMNSVILSAPTERAASVASLTQTANEIGIAVGLVVFGSIGALAYRSDLRATTGRAEGTWVDGLRAARSRPSLLPYVQNSFTTGFHIAAMAAVAVLLVALAIQRKRRPTEAVTFVQEEPATVAS